MSFASGNLDCRSWNLVRGDHPEALSKAILTVKPIMKPIVVTSIVRCCRFHGQLNPLIWRMQKGVQDVTG